MSFVPLPDRLRGLGGDIDWSKPRDDRSLLGLKAIACCIARQFSEGGSRSALRLESLSLELFLRLADSVADCREPEWVARIADAIAANPSAPTSLDALGKLAGVHRVHVVKGFKRWRGCTPGQFIRRARLEMAIDLIQNRTRPVGNAAIEAGFADQSHLLRVLRREYGLTIRALDLQKTNLRPLG